MNCMPKDAIDIEDAQRMLPSLIRGYLRLGAYIGNGAAIDYQFGTTDVLIVLPVSAMNARFIERLGQLVVSRAA
jgi:putative hemolysin